MNSIFTGTMKRKPKPVYQLERPVPVKYRVTFDDYELQQRRLARDKKTFVEKEHELWFGDGKRKARELAVLQNSQRKAGRPDADFLHPLDPRRTGV
jgi:hypothetical protein